MLFNYLHFSSPSFLYWWKTNYFYHCLVKKLEEIQTNPEVVIFQACGKNPELEHNWIFCNMQFYLDVISQAGPGPVSWTHSAAGEDMVPEQTHEVEENGKW